MKRFIQLTKTVHIICTILQLNYNKTTVDIVHLVLRSPTHIPNTYVTVYHSVKQHKHLWIQHYTRLQYSVDDCLFLLQ